MTRSWGMGGTRRGGQPAFRLQISTPCAFERQGHHAPELAATRTATSVGVWPDPLKSAAREARVAHGLTLALLLAGELALLGWLVWWPAVIG